VSQPVPLWCEVVIFSGLAVVLILAIRLGLTDFRGGRNDG
jgi:hypothetical protein